MQLEKPQGNVKLIELKGDVLEHQVAFETKVEVAGRYSPQQRSLTVESLIYTDLNHLIGRRVRFKTRTYSMNDDWRFSYAKQEVAVGRYRKKPGFREVSHGGWAIVEGKLFKEIRVTKDVGFSDQLELQFVIKDATINADPEAAKRPLQLVSIYDEFPRFTQGVPDYNLESYIRYNIMGWENDARIFYTRNYRMIGEIIRRDSPATRAGLRERLADGKRKWMLRLLDAGVLAALNDPAGRTFLVEQARRKDKVDRQAVYWMIGNLYQFPPDPPVLTKRDASLATTEPDRTGKMDLSSLAESLFGPPRKSNMLGSVKMDWAAELMMDALSRPPAPPKDAVPEFADFFLTLSPAYVHGGFAELLFVMKDKAGIEQLVKRYHVLNEIDENVKEMERELLQMERSRLLRLLMRYDHPIAIAEAKRWLAEKDNLPVDRQNLQGFLLVSEPEYAIDSLIESLHEWYAFRSLQSLDPKTTSARIKQKLLDLNGETKKQAELFLVLIAPDRKQQLLARLKSKDAAIRLNTIYYLSQNPDIEVARALSGLLIDGPDKYFVDQGGWVNTSAVEHVINGCAIEGSTESLQILISFLGVKYERFCQHMPEDKTVTESGGLFGGTREQSHKQLVTEMLSDTRLVAVRHLIDFTDVSFGDDQAKWQAWFDKKYPDARKHGRK